MKVSIIVPTLNEELVLENTLVQIQQLSPHELIISDGGSDDDTCKIAERFSHLVISSSVGRSLQMNAGADEATGDLLLFLHADSRLELEGFRKMLKYMEDPKWMGGAFSLCIESESWSLKLISSLANIRSKYFGLAYGDQGFFVRKKVFNNMNGFATIPICEDLDFYHRMKKKGPVIHLKEKAYTSPRRWLQEGFFFTTARNIMIAILFGIGFPPDTLIKWYPPDRGSK